MHISPTTTTLMRTLLTSVVLLAALGCDGNLQSPVEDASQAQDAAQAVPESRPPTPASSVGKHPDSSQFSLFP